MGSGDGGGSGGGGGFGPCGACKFLRRKCVKNCVFAPYFDSDQGTAHFAAVHRVFGASNATKLLIRIPPHRRLDAVVTLCYEAMARVRDPVYGCVGHIFTLQQQVVNLQTELAYVQARIAMLQPVEGVTCSDFQSSPVFIGNDNSTTQWQTDVPNFEEEASIGMGSYCNSVDEDQLADEDDDLQSLTRAYVSTYFPGVRFTPPT